MHPKIIDDLALKTKIFLTSRQTAGATVDEVE